MLKSIQIKKATVEKDIVIAIPVKKIKGNTQFYILTAIYT
jgi:hypothetical protein